MTSDRALALLKRENPFNEDDLPAAAAPKALLLRERILLEEAPREARAYRTRARRRLVGVTAATASLATVTAVAAFLVVGYPGGGPAVENAAAAVRQAAVVTAASAELSGTAVVRITHGDELWAKKTIRWNGGDLALSGGDAGRAGRARDLALSGEDPSRVGRAGAEFLLVDGTMYGIEDGRWVELGSPESIDPDSGTTPAEYLAAVRQDVSGVTLRRLTEGMTGLTTRELDDGWTVYSGSVAAGLVARESGFKEGQSIRVLPFGYVAHDEAADPAAALDAAVTVGADGIIRELRVTWGTRASAWTYEVTYSGLGATSGPVAPTNARPLRDWLRAG
jgi:hypothetical protein